jgi:hypothetical protein
VATRDRIYLLGKPEQIASPFVEWATPAPGGRYLLCGCRKKLPGIVPDEEEIPSEIRFVLWDTKTWKYSTLFRTVETIKRRVRIGVVCWFDNNAAIVLLSENKSLDENPKSLFFVHCGSGTVRQISTFEDNGFMVSSLSSSGSKAILYDVSSPFQTLWHVTDTGQVTPLKLKWPARHVVWSRDERRFYVMHHLKSIWALMGPDQPWKEFDQPPFEDFAETSKPLVPPLKISARETTLTTEASKEKTTSLWLIGEDALGIRVTAETTFPAGIVLPDLSAIAYRDREMYCIAPLVSLDRRAYDEAMKRAPEELLRSTPPGIVGRLEAPGGHAWVYADGRIKWVGS